MIEQRRAFTNAEKIAVGLVTGESGEGDHVIPYSDGGATSVDNCQLLSPSANKEKSAFSFRPREWQSEFFRAWDARDPNQSSFMLNAAPGSGKTMAALELARVWKSRRSDRQIIVVVPSDNLREQWRDEAALFGLSLQTKEFGNNFKDGFHGVVITYQGLQSNSLILRVLCGKCPTMVIFDEIHHCGEDASFGIAVKQAFELASERLLLSGTPWKSDGAPIPFISYDNSGYAVCDYTYSHSRALNDKVLRHLVFDHAAGVIVNDLTGCKEVLDKDVSDEDASKRLRRILAPEGEYAKGLILKAHEKLMQTRSRIPDAAAMAVCIDQQHAKRVATLIRQVTGCTPSVIISDDVSAKNPVKAFRESNKEWLVSVKKVSEGTDIKRLQVLCYLTNVTSELFFRQVIGRVCRLRKKDDFEAYVYLPSDPRLISMASTIKDMQKKALSEKIERDIKEQKERELTQSDFFDSYSTEHNGTQVVITGDEPLAAEEARRIEMMAATAGVSMTQVMQILALNNDQPVTLEAAQPIVPLEELMDDLRHDCSTYTRKIANKLLRSRGIYRGQAGYPAACQKACIEVNKMVKPFVPVKEANEKQLRHKRATLLHILDSGDYA